MPTPDRLTTIARAAIAALDPTGRAWRAGMERAISAAHTAAYLAGTAERLGVQAGGALLSERRLSRAERREIQAAVAAQLRYLDGFDPSQMSEAAARARAALYAGAVKATYYLARWGDWELPWVPGDGSTECLGNCLCSASVKDNSDGTGVYTWVLGAGESERHCTTCPSRAGDHPVKRRGR